MVKTAGAAEAPGEEHDVLLQRVSGDQHLPGARHKDVLRSSEPGSAPVRRKGVLTVRGQGSVNFRLSCTEVVMNPAF